MSLQLMGQVLSFEEGEYPARDGRPARAYCRVTLLGVTTTKAGPNFDLHKVSLAPGSCEPRHIGKVCTVAVNARSSGGYEANLWAVDGARLIETTEEPFVEVNPKFRHPADGHSGYGLSGVGTGANAKGGKAA